MNHQGAAPHNYTATQQCQNWLHSSYTCGIIVWKYWWRNTIQKYQKSGSKAEAVLLLCRIESETIDNTNVSVSEEWREASRQNWRQRGTEWCVCEAHTSYRTQSLDLTTQHQRASTPSTPVFDTSINSVTAEIGYMLMTTATSTASGPAAVIRVKYQHEPKPHYHWRQTPCRTLYQSRSLTACLQSSWRILISSW